MFGHLDVGDGATGGQALELALELELGEGVDLLAHVHVVAVRDVAVVGDARDDAEAALQGLGELVRRGLERRAVEEKSMLCSAFHSAHLSFMCCMTKARTA
jgi:hypothetical protein